MTKPGFDRRLDGVQWRTSSLLEKWTPDQVAELDSSLIQADDMIRAGILPAERVEDFTSNLLTTAGLNRITSLIIGGGGQALTNTSARIGVGDDSTAASVGQTDLVAASGSSHRYFQPMDATYPTQSNGVITAKATFGTGDGNFAWQEWCLDVGTPTVAGGTTVAALMLNRKVASLGTKVSGAIWALTVTVTLS